MLFSAIDIGSNAGRLLFTNVFEHKDKVVFEKSSLIRVPLRLGIDSFELGKITDEKIENLVNTMKAFKHLIEVYKPLAYKAYATAALRESMNKGEIVNCIEKETGIKIEIIDGLKEAEIVCASHNMDPENKDERFLYVDVGGGSVELSVIKSNKLAEYSSFDIGTIRILQSSVKAEEWERFIKWLQNLRSKYDEIICVGSGGNINKLSKLYGKKGAMQLPYSTLRKGYRELKGLPLEARIEELGLRPDRADVIVPAAKLFLTIMRNVNSNKVLVPRIGLSDGIIHNLYCECKNKKCEVV
ncbi:MAG: Ppx/GppA family phosphatase [Bacteroidales bacterium]|jgi:exopolyphosphatase/guanosine-5'-triphosphate,3'-diphosphate pyrophosphatase